MEITEIRVQLLPRPIDRLCAFVCITIDGAFAVRDIKVIERAGGPFVAMPSRRLTERCGRCGGKNPIGARYCASCGARAAGEADPRARRYSDVCHPIHQAARQQIETAVLDAYRDEVERARRPDYRPLAPDEFERDLLAEYSTDG